MMEKLFSIGKLSKMTGVTTRTIRHYDGLGLLESVEKTPSDYRMYDEGSFQKLQQILLLKTLGFSLDDIKSIFLSDDPGGIHQIFQQRLEKIENESQRLIRQRDMLRAVTQVYKKNGLTYINNFHLMKEMVSMQTRVMQIFNRLHVGLQTQILKELYHTGSLSPETLKAVGPDHSQGLLEALHLMAIKALLNGMDHEGEQALMHHMHNHEPALEKIAINAIFTFDDIARLPDEVIAIWADHCDDEALVIALKDCNNYLTDRILSNVSKERCQALRVKIDDGQLVSLDKAYKTMEALIELLRSLEKDNKVVLQRFN